MLERSPEIVAIDARKSFKADLLAAIDVSPMVQSGGDGAMMALEHLFDILSAPKVNAGCIVTNVAIVLSWIALDAAGVDDVVRLLSANTASCCAFIA